MRQTDELDALRVERLLPREDVLIDAVDERAVEVEEEGRARCASHWSLTLSSLDEIGSDGQPRG